MDFDGLIVDTETPEYEAWREVFESYGQTLDLAKWVTGIGSLDTFDPYEHLSELIGKPVDREAIRAKRRPRFLELMAKQGPLPGVADYLCDARRLGIKVAIASSSPLAWIEEFLPQLDLPGRFDAIATADDVARTKPDPAVYRVALRKLGVGPDEAIALEDSPNGVTAARAAGIFCAAVPNRMTRALEFDANLMLDSLAALPLADLISMATGASRSKRPVLYQKPGL
jgi:HAD superfamily hydrolase (TIGR01509 family)